MSRAAGPRRLSRKMNSIFTRDKDERRQTWGGGDLMKEGVGLLKCGAVLIRTTLRLTTNYNSWTL